MKVILSKDVPNLGDAGDVKVVADGYARNFLLPKKLVIPFNESSKKAMDYQKQLIKTKKDELKKESESVADKLKALEIRVKVKVGEDDRLFGSVTAMDLSRTLNDLGYAVDKRKIHMEEPIKQLGTFSVPVKLDEGVTANISVIVEKE
jgi:large subunit ribosomal protein L9